MRKILLLITTAALVGGTSGIASAESFTAMSLVQENNASCGRFVENQPIIGSAKFTRTFNTLKVTYKAKHLAKSTTYDLAFYNNTAGVCEFLGEPASAVTTSTGAVTIKGEMTVPEKDYEFFVSGFSTGGPPFTNDSFTVVLPRP